MDLRLFGTCLVALLAGVACGPPPPRAVPRSAPLAAPTRPAPNVTAASLKQPFVLLVTSNSGCGTGRRDIDLEPFLREDAKYARSSRAVDGVLDNPSASTLKDALTKRAHAGDFGSGLVLLYSGHAVECPPAPGGAPSPPRTCLCLKQPELAEQKPLPHLQPVHEFLGWFRDAARPGSPAAVPWLTLVLNACESAMVDVRDAPMPVALLSASSSPITVHRGTSCASSTVGGPTRSTPLLRSVVDALTSPERAHHDQNQDGMVSARELLRIAKAAANSPMYCDFARPEPRLALQAKSDLPVRFHARAGAARARVRELLERSRGSAAGAPEQALIAGIRTQLALGEQTALPESPWDFLVTADEGLKSVLARRYSAPTGATPCPGEPRFSTADLGLSVAERRQLAKFSAFTEFYELIPNGSWVDVIRMRDGRLMATTQRDRVAEAIPRRLYRQDLGDAAWQRSVTEIAAAPAACSPAVAPSASWRLCIEEEGQCFVSR